MRDEKPEVGLLNYGRVLRLSAQKFAERPFLVFEGRSYPYRFFNEEVNGVALALQADGIGAGDRVMLMSENTPQYLRLLFALAKIGAVAVPLNTMLPRDAIRDVVLVSTPRSAYVSAKHAEAFLAATNDVPGGKRPLVHLMSEDLGQPSEQQSPQLTATATAEAAATTVEPLPARHIGDDEPAVILFSSGSTGNPQGIVKSFANLTWSAINRQIAEPRSDASTEYFCLPLAGIAFANFVLTDALTGATCFMARRFSAAQASKDLREGGVTHVFLAPTMIRAISDAAPSESYPSVLRVESSFEFPIELRRRAIEMFPNATILWSFGSTEATMARTPPEVFLADTTCVGFASGLDEYRVRSLETGEVLTEPGSVGEVESRGPTRMLCYLRDLPNGRMAKPTEWFATGDLGDMDEAGRLHFRGRIKDMIKSGGANVFARDVENALTQHPAVRDAAVVGVPDEYWGEKVVAVLELSTRDQIDTLGSMLELTLAPYQRPKELYVVAELPKNPTGKLAKGVIRDLISRGELEVLSLGRPAGDDQR